MIRLQILAHALGGHGSVGGEFDDYVTEVFQLNGFKTENELVDEAKN